MESLTLLERVQRALRPHALGEVTATSRFVADLGFDELAVVDSIIALEDEFDIEISDEDSMAWESVDQALLFLRDRLS